MIGSRRLGARRRPRALVLLAGIALATGCAREPRGPVNVLLIGIDTLRADHVGCYGYPRPTTPRIDALATESVVFEQAIAQAPWTLPSFASILTGVRPGRHGAGEGKNCLFKPCGALRADRVTLAELFARAGYRTASFVTNGFVGKDVGLARGFELTEERIAGRQAVELAIPWLEAHRDDPFFVFLHLIEPHAPYLAPPEDVGPFLDPAYRGPVESGNASTPLRTWTAPDRERVVDLYDGDVHLADRLAGMVLDTLDRLGIDDRTLVVVVSDHGEELFERGQVGHGQSVYDELLWVPLVVRFPGGTPRGRVAHQVRAMDVFPTILEVAGLPVPAGIDAVGLAGMAHGEAAPARTAAAIAEFTFSGPEQRAVRHDRQKLILDVDHDTTQLFDLRTDGGELVNLSARRPERVELLREKLARTDATSVAGFYVRARGGFEPHRVRIEVRAGDVGIPTATLLHKEDGDTVEVSSDGLVTATLTLDKLDTDDIRIVTGGGVPPVLTVVSVTIDDEPLPLDRLVLGSTETAKALPLSVAAATVAGRRISTHVPLDGNVRVAVQAVPPRARPSLDMDQKTRDHLRALGYAE